MREFTPSTKAMLAMETSDKTWSVVIWPTIAHVQTGGPSWANWDMRVADFVSERHGPAHGLVSLSLGGQDHARALLTRYHACASLIHYYVHIVGDHGANDYIMLHNVT